MLFISADDGDTLSKKMKSDVFFTKEFKKSVAKDFILCNLDFSQSEYAKGQVDEKASDKEKQTAKKASDQFNRNVNIATTYNVQETPAVFILTKEGYVISLVKNDTAVTTPDDYRKLLDTEKDNILKTTTMVKATATGENLDKVKAIDTLYEATDNNYRYALSDLIRQIPALDANNESGLVGKYVLATANSDAMDAYMKKDTDGSINAFVKAAESGKVDKEQKQQAYYMAGYLLGSSGSQDYDKMISYFQASYDADPDSSYAPRISQMVMMVKSMKEKASAAAPETSKNDSPAAGTTAQQGE